VFLVANLLFIASFTRSPHVLMPFAVFLAWGYLSVRMATVLRGSGPSALFVFGTLLLFCWLKKYWFLSFLSFLPFPYLSIGLSYAFFRVMGLIIDARYDPAIARIGPLDYFNFAMNFPTMVAGPIDRYQEFSKAGEPLSTRLIGRGFERITAGFFKVMVLSASVSTLQIAATQALAADADMSQRVLQSLLSFGLYPIYLYFNFSGYTDIVIGVGNLFGKHYPENFNAPFSSFSFIEFWSRWHMTLSNWLRDYVYTPLLKYLMSRSPSANFDPYLGVIAYFVTFFLIGIWHGSTVIFAIYGLLLAAGVSINKLWQIYLPRLIGKKPYRQLAAQTPYRYLARGLTYTWYSFCMICFWAKGDEALAMLHALGSAGMAASFVGLLVAATILINLWEEIVSGCRRGLSGLQGSDFLPFAKALLGGLLVFGCIAMVIVTKRIDTNIIYQAF
jgi:D-alanyl-lipoteichoic acid acyltransferase DltB (MBOAT superfamily)